ncbi:hypothetical protein QBC40DRAFT_262075 [Triangularia verruculosa]|uniref:Tat pathway signal sequence n=1 Tax=Triangularia verruculosa TaxID=2587418 RepID=A0AAN6XNI2_9PEZI|nr:hypothetical protein QBC40DRAFT_262075 [Triangularia verruculosa]
MAPGSRSSSRLSQPLPMIIEDVVHSTTPPPGMPPKSPRRPPVSMSNSQNSLHSNHRSRTSPSFGGGTVPGGGVRPPSISSTTVPGTSKAEVTQQNSASGERRDQGPVARKGWYRMMLGTLLIVGVIVGLSVGLTIGLRKRNQKPQSEPDTSTLFPAGSYTFTTALLPNTSTSCLTLASFSLAWQCYSSPSDQTSTFHWTIHPSPRNTYTISSTPRMSNTSEPQFQNLSLTTLDINQFAERLTFSFIYPKPVSLSIPVNNSAGEEKLKCWFNTTVLTATIFTRQRATWPEHVGTANTTAITGSEPKEGEERIWPFLVEVSERQLGDEEGTIPDCYYTNNGTHVDLLGLMPAQNGTAGEGEGGECGCWYRNFGLGSSQQQQQQPPSNGTVPPERLRRGR